MPLLAGAITSFFAFLAAVLSKKLTLGTATAAAFVATSGATFLAVKIALAALTAGLEAALPPDVVTMAGFFMPTNLGGCLTVVLLADAINTSYEWWQQQVRVAFGIAAAS